MVICSTQQESKLPIEKLDFQFNINNIYWQEDEDGNGLGFWCKNMPSLINMIINPVLCLVIDVLWVCSTAFVDGSSVDFYVFRRVVCWVNILNFVQSNEFPWAVWSCWWHCKYLDILIFGVYLNVRLLFKLSKFLTNSDVHKSTINSSFRISLPVKTTWIVTSTFGIVEKVLKVYGHNIFVLNYSC